MDRIPTVTGNCYLKALTHYAFRPDQTPIITKVVMVEPPPMRNKLTEIRPCFEVMYADNFIDYVPVSELGTSYKIVGVAQ